MTARFSVFQSKRHKCRNSKFLSEGLALIALRVSTSFPGSLFFSMEAEKRDPGNEVARVSRATIQVKF